jgi:hypothetical protein
MVDLLNCVTFKVKVKLPPCLTKYQSMKTYPGYEAEMGRRVGLFAERMCYGMRLCIQSACTLDSDSCIAETPIA